MPRSTLLIAGLIVLCVAGRSFGGLAVVTGAANADQWFGNAGAYSTITFNEFPYGTLISNQYASLGIHFVEPQGNWIYGSDVNGTDLFVQDGWGLHGENSIDMRFDTPIRGLAAYYPGVVKAQFFSGEQLVYSWTQNFGGGSNKFAGFFGDVAFDRVVFKNANNPPPWGSIYPVKFDNLYFTTVPAPGVAVCLLGGVSIVCRRRERKGSAWSAADGRSC